MGINIRMSLRSLTESSNQVTLLAINTKSARQVSLFLMHYIYNICNTVHTELTA